MSKYSELINHLLDEGFTQIQIANYLGVTRQTIASINLGKYVKLSEKASRKLSFLESQSKSIVETIFKIDLQLDELKESVISKDGGYISQAAVGINDFHYWITSKKFESNLRYHKAYFGHMSNFLPRYNQAGLFMRDYFKRQEYALVTLQVDYDKKLITQLTIKSFVPEYARASYDLSNEVYPLDFSRLAYILKTKLLKPYRFMVWKDFLDDEWEFIKTNVKKNEFPDGEIFDLSRLFNYLEHPIPYFGPLLERVLTQFRIKFDLHHLLSDSDYRADRIIELVNMVSLYQLSKEEPDNYDRLFDSHGLKNNNHFNTLERRKLKNK